MGIHILKDLVAIQWGYKDIAVGSLSCFLLSKESIACCLSFHLLHMKALPIPFPFHVLHDNNGWIFFLQITMILYWRCYYNLEVSWDRALGRTAELCSCSKIFHYPSYTITKVHQMSLACSCNRDPMHSKTNLARAPFVVFNQFNTLHHERSSIVFTHHIRFSSQNNNEIR